MTNNSYSYRLAGIGCIKATIVLFATLSVNLWAESVNTNIKKDENIVFFRTDANYLADADEWQIPIHGWVYEEERSWFRKNAFARVMERKYGLTLDDDNSTFFDRRTGLLIADNERDKRVVVKIGDQQYSLPESAPNGHFLGQITIGADALEAIADGGVVRYRAVLPADDEREFMGEFRLVEPNGTSIISDIDDTVKVTGVINKKDLMNSTFYKEFAAVPGMAKRYQEWASQGLDVHFLSSSPWQLYPELLEFAQVNDFPWASFYLKSVRFKDSTVLNLFKEGSVTKPIQIAELMERFPDRQFVLIGDSGEHDPEAYTMMMEQYPERIEGIYIRNVTEASLEDDRFSALMKKLPEGAMELFDDPKQIALQLD